MNSKMRLKDLSKLACAFYECLDERKWTDAEVLITRIQNSQTNKGEEWTVGYINALQGMLVAKKNNSSSVQPLIQKLVNSSQNRLNDLKTSFYTQSRRRLHSDFDRGFFRIWYEYIRFLMDRVPHNEGV